MPVSKQLIQKIAKKVCAPIKKWVFPPGFPFPENKSLVKSYSQYGEDLLIDAILGCKPTGVYVDIGANDPVNLNNTKRFYDRGWCGINIEPNPHKFNTLIKNRPHDINLNIGVTTSESRVPFYILKLDVYSTYDYAIATRNCQLYHTEISNVVEINVSPLNKVLECLNGQVIDFMSIDVEGGEMFVLNSNDWNKFRPRVILIEIRDNTEKILNFLTSKNYLPILSNQTNAIFLDSLNNV